MRHICELTLDRSHFEGEALTDLQWTNVGLLTEIPRLTLRMDYR